MASVITRAQSLTQQLKKEPVVRSRQQQAGSAQSFRRAPLHTAYKSCTCSCSRTAREGRCMNYPNPRFAWTQRAMTTQHCHPLSVCWIQGPRPGGVPTCISTVPWAGICFSVSFWKARVLPMPARLKKSQRLKSQAPKSLCNFNLGGHYGTALFPLTGFKALTHFLRVCRKTKSCT